MQITSRFLTSHFQEILAPWSPTSLESWNLNHDPQLHLNQKKTHRVPSCATCIYIHIHMCANTRGAECSIRGAGGLLGPPAKPKFWTLRAAQGPRGFSGLRWLRNGSQQQISWFFDFSPPHVKFRLAWTFHHEFSGSSPFQNLIPHVKNWGWTKGNWKRLTNTRAHAQKNKKLPHIVSADHRSKFAAVLKNIAWWFAPNRLYKPFLPSWSRPWPPQKFWHWICGKLSHWESESSLLWQVLAWPCLDWLGEFKDLCQNMSDFPRFVRLHHRPTLPQKQRDRESNITCR